MATPTNHPQSVEFRDPPFARALFDNPAWAWVWLLARLYIGWKWLDAGWDKLHDPKWMETGVALKGFWERAVLIPEKGRPAIAYDWYRDFLRELLEGGHYVWFAKLVAVGEFALGIALIVGIFVGIAALAGGFMNWNFMMAGTASVNPVLLVMSVGLVLAWKTAGWIGLDRWVLPALGTPWQRGQLFHNGTGIRPALAFAKLRRPRG
jgi:thiosulfate dehydrogenase [quinone] large subunit